MKKTIYIWMILIASIGSSCNDFLDIVPDGVSTLDNAFSRRTEAKRYLFTCYSYMPEQGDVSTAMALWGDEMWTMENAIHYDFNLGAFNIARGLQNSNAPLLDHWGHYYQALRDCNIFLENLEDLSKVQDIEAWERAQWIAEAKFVWPGAPYPGEFADYSSAGRGACVSRPGRRLFRLHCAAVG